MTPSAIVTLSLLALASAAPQHHQHLRLHCVKSCDPEREAIVGDVGKTYSFNYNVLSFVSLAGVNEGVTQGGLTGRVDISRINPCELTIKFTNSDGHAKVNKYPLVASIIGDGQFGKVCTHPEDDSESINIKKGIASQIQYSLPSFRPTNKHIVSERSVLGTCPTVYSIENNGYNKVVNKEIVHSECQDHVYSQSEFPSILSKSPIPLQVSKSVCTQVFSSSKVPQTITCKDTKVVRPAYGTYKYIEATQESTLQLISESNDMSVLSSINQSHLLSKKLSHDHSMPAKNPALVGKLDTVLSKVCEMVRGQGHQGTASIVNKAIELMKHIPDDAFLTVLRKIRAGDYCDDYSKLEAIYLDVIAYIGEPGALKVIAQEVSTGRVTGGRTALYTAAINLLSKPTEKHAAALAPIAAMENPSSAHLLAAATVINKYRNFLSENVKKIFTDKLVNQCTPSFSKSNPITVLTTLKALGNIGNLTPEHAEMVIECAKTEGVETNVRFAATMALQGTPCKTPVKNALLAIALNQGMNTEVRIGSYLSAINCADEDDFKKIITNITTDSNKQVHSFVLSHLNNLKETTWPMKAHMKKLLNNMKISTNYERNVFKYSRNIEMSYNTPTLGIGGTLDSNIVFTPESYIPQLVNLGIDMNLLGSFVNIGEVGARIEGLDPIIKEVFGPESFLYKIPLSKILKNTSLFIKENGANFFNKLEKLLRHNESVDIKSLIESVSNFLKAYKIKLPKTDLYAKLLGQEYAFLSLANSMQEVNINHVIEAITSAVTDALVAGKDYNANTARAAHLTVDYNIPTIQGIPLKIKVESTAVIGIHVQSKLKSKHKTHDADLKFIPSLSFAIDCHIGYGAVMKHGLKMQIAIYSTNGLAIYASLKNWEDLELKLELPEKIELINVKSELYQVTTNNLMDEIKVYPSYIIDVRIAKEQCSAADPVTGLHICYNMNIPDILESNSLPLGMPAKFNIYLRKSYADMKGYRAILTLKNEADNKVLKMVTGTYGSASSTESSVMLTHTNEANSYETAAVLKSLWFTTSVEANFIHQEDLMSLQILTNHKLKFVAPKVFAYKFDVMKEAIANGYEYQVTGFAGLTETLTEPYKFINVKMLHAKNDEFTKLGFLVNIETSALPLTIGFGVDIPSKAPWFTVIRKVDLKVTAGKTAVEGLVLRKISGQYHKTLTIQHDGSNVILIEATNTITGDVFKNLNFVTEGSAKLGNKEFGSTFTFKHENAVIDTIWELRNTGDKVFNINIKHSMESYLYTTTFEIGLPTLTKILKFSNVIKVVEFLNYKIMTDVRMDNTALLHIEGPVSLQFSKIRIKHNIDLKISGTFDGTVKVINAALLSPEKCQYIFDMRHSTTPITMIDIIIDRTNTVETTAKAVIHVPVLIKTEYAAVLTSHLLHTTMNTFILPTTYLARRFKGYADFDLNDQKLKTDFYWDAEKDTTKKIALTTGFKTDIALGKALVQGDLIVTTLAYGFKLEAMMASPFEWFSGTSGIELGVTAPSNKALVAKVLCIVEHTKSLVLFTPLMALHTFNENKYEIAGSFAIKNLPGVLNVDISSEFIINVPQIKKITIATKFLHEDKNGECALVFKSGITGLNEPINLEIRQGASENKYTTLFKVQRGSTVGSLASKVALISGFKAFDITVDASIPFAAVKSLSMRATKTADGTLNLIYSRNQKVLTKFHYLMITLTAHTFSFESTSRLIDFFVSFSVNEITMKVFTENKMSAKILETILRVNNRIELAHVECFVAAPSSPNEMRIAAEFSLSSPTNMEQIVDVNVQFPTSEFKTLVNELNEIYEDLVKDGVVPDMTVVYKQLKFTLRELPKYANSIKMQFRRILTVYWNKVKNWALRMWENYQASVIALIKAAYTELLHYWEILKIEVPILYNDFLAIVKKTEKWKMLYEMVNKKIEQYPVQYNILPDFYNKVILTTVTDIRIVVNRIMNLPSFGIEPLSKFLKNELPTIFTNLRKQLLNSELMTVIIKKFTDMEVQYPTVYTAMVEIWACIFEPFYRDLVAAFRKLMNIHFTNMSQIIDHALKEIPAFFNTLGTEVMCVFITIFKEFIETNPMIRSVYDTSIGVYHNIMMALLGDLSMFYEKLMNIPLIKKVVEWVQHIINSQNAHLAFSFESFAATVHSFVSEVLGVTYTIEGDHISAVVTLPASVSTLKHMEAAVTANLPLFVAESIKSLDAVRKKIPVFFTAMKGRATIFAKFVSEHIPIIVRAVETHVPKFLNELAPVLNNLIVFLMNNEVTKYLVCKADETIRMYQTQFNIMKENFERFFAYAIECTILSYAKIMEVSIIRRTVEYIWGLIHHNDIHTNMISSLNSVSSNIISYSLIVSSSITSFIKLHTPKMVTYWLSSLIH